MLDVLKKHWTVLVAAWSEENHQKLSRQKYKEEEFLPAALEILEKPPSPLGRGILWAIATFFTIAVLWSVFGRVDVVATAPGKTLPREHVKIVQASEAGVVRAIHVENGVLVQRDDPLIDLDPTNAAADQVQAREQLTYAEIDLARGEALLSFIEAGSLNFDASGMDTHIAKRQRALIEAQAAEHLAQVIALEKQRTERLADIEVTKSQVRKLRQTLPMVREQMQAREILEREGFGARLLLLEAQERKVAMEQDLAIARDQLVKAQAAVGAADQAIAQLKEEFRASILMGLADSETKARIAREDLTKAELRYNQQSLKSPARGVVQQLGVHTIGAVVQPTDALLVVVPEGSELIVEATLLNKDFGFVKEGDLVEVKLESFPFTKYGVIEGVVEDISNDAIQDENLGLIYAARIKLQRQTINVNGRQIKLSPGMVATAEIKTGKRRIIEFLLSPLLRYRDEALRER